MKYKLFIVFLFLISIINSQNKTNLFNGEIVFRIQEKITDVKAFEASLKTLTTKYDSILNLIEEKEAFSNFSKPTLKLVLDPRERNNTIPIICNYKFNDSIVKIENFKFGKSIGKVKIINILNNSYDIITSKGLKSTKQNYIYKLKVEKDYTIKEYRDTLKSIHGYNCFKVILREKYNIKIGDINFKDVFPEVIKYTEMYVTDKIKSIYHPTINNKIILTKYYPLELKEWSDNLNGKVVFLSTIELKND